MHHPANICDYWQYGEDASDSFRTHGRRQGALAYHYLNGEDLAQEVISCFTFITYDAPPNTGRLRLVFVDCHAEVLSVAFLNIEELKCSDRLLVCII